MSMWDEDTITIGGDIDGDDMAFSRKKKKKREPEPVPEVAPSDVYPEDVEISIDIGGAEQNTAEEEPEKAPEPKPEPKPEPVVEKAPEPKMPEKKPEPERKPEPAAAAPAEKKPAPAKKETISSTISLKDAAAAESGMNFEKKFLVSSSPHIHYGETTKILMQDVVIAMLPTAIVAALYFGLRAVLTMALCVGTCVLSEYICRRVMKRRQTIGDWSAVVTGLLLAFSLPPTINPVYAVIGSAVAIVVVKQMFGGIGMNFANPAVTARIVLFMSFTSDMCTFERPFYWLTTGYDAVSGATPLAAGLTPAEQADSLFELFLGYHTGCLGETCAVTLLLGGGYLLLRNVITWEIPVTFIGTVFILSWIFGMNPLFAILSGGVLLGAIFMATDYVTSPVNKTGRIVFGIGCGLLTVIIRRFTNMPEGVSFAILLMNILVPHIERLTMPKPFGEEREAA